MRRILAGSALAMACGLVAHSGCVGVGGDGHSDLREEDELVLGLMEDLGYHQDDIELADTRIIVDKDLIFFREKLLNGEYAPVTEVDLESDPTEKGYRHPNAITVNVANIKLAFAAGATTPIKNAFINAAGDINSVANCNVVVSQNNTGPTITVREVAAVNWGTTPCAASEPACTTAPSGGNVSTDIYVKASGIAPGCSAWSNSAMDFAFRHELLHALGFTHVKQAGSIQVFDSAVCSGTATTCADMPGYTTVMKKTLELDSSTCAAQPWIPTILASDDRLTLSILF